MSFSNLGSKVFFIWGGFCFICTAYVYFFVYETKGLSLEQVDELYAKVSDARKSPGFIPTVHFVDMRNLGEDAVRRTSLANLEMAAMGNKSAAVVTDTDVPKDASSFP